MQDQAHRDDLRAGKRVHEEVTRGGHHALGQPCGRNGSLGDRGYDREVETRAPQMRIAGGENRAELSVAPPTSQRAVGGEVELLRQRLKVTGRGAFHRVHELLQPGWVAVQLLEHRLPDVLDLILRLPDPQSLRESAQNRYRRALYISRMPPM